MNTRSTASRYLERAIYVVVFIGLILCLVGCDGRSVYTTHTGERANNTVVVEESSEANSLHAADAPVLATAEGYSGIRIVMSQK